MIPEASFSALHARDPEPARTSRSFGVTIADGPALNRAAAGLIAPSRTPLFFSFYAAARFFQKTLKGMLAQIKGEVFCTGPAEAELCNRRLQQVLDG